MSNDIEIIIDTRKFEKKLAKLQALMPTVLQKSALESMDLVSWKSNNILSDELTWGHSWNPEERIEENWKKSLPVVTKNTVIGTLSNESPHARIVEYGAFGTIEKEDGAFPVGLQQGIPVQFSKTIQLQDGKYYLLRSSWEAIPEIKELTKKNIHKALNSL